MKIFPTFLYVVGVLTIQNSVTGKSLIFNKFNNGPHFEKQDDIAYEDSKENLNKESVEALLNSYKRSVDDIDMDPIKEKMYGSSLRKRSPYGLVYNQGKPIGILEPIAQSFEYSAYAPRDSSYRNGPYKSQWFPVKRESEFEMDDLEKEQLESQSSALHSANYANVLAKFKVNNKVKHRPYQDYLNSQVKRAAPQEISRRKEIEELKKRGAIDMGDLKTNIKGKNKGSSMAEESLNADSKVDEIEDNLKDVMSDLGLVEKEKKETAASKETDTAVKKREIYFEDEDLENGLNKIGLTKESHYDRNKKEDCPGKTKVAKSKGSRKYSLEKSVHKKGKKKVKKDDQSNTKRSVKTNRKRVAEKKDIETGDLTKVKVANYQYEGEEFIRRKRQGKEAANKAEDSEIMKGLETSGDLTVSGNKSPLVAVTNADDLESKKSQEKRDKEELEYEKRLERNIQAKINSIKEEVKREISKLKVNDAKLDQQRKKREVTNTLLDEESSILDPRINIDEKLEPHIRKRRHLDDNSGTAEESDKHKRELNSNKRSEIDNKLGAETATKANKIIREVKKDSLNKVSDKEKRSNNAKELHKSNDNAEKQNTELVDKNLMKRSDKTQAKMEPLNDNSHDVKLSKKVEKRDDAAAAYTANDKTETDNKAEFGTDVPDSIVKRNDQTSAPLNENLLKGIEDLNSDPSKLVKRNEQLLDAVTDKPLDNTENVKNRDGESSNSREERNANEIADIKTGQTILKDIDLESDNEARAQRQSSNSDTINKLNVKNEDELNTSEDEQEEGPLREERAMSSKSNKDHDCYKQRISAINDNSLKRNSDVKIEDKLKDRNRRGSAKSVSSENQATLQYLSENKPSITEEGQEVKDSIKQRSTHNDYQADDGAVEEKSTADQKFETDALEDTINERSTISKPNFSAENADAELTDSVDTEVDESKKMSGKAEVSGIDAFASKDVEFNDVTNDEDNELQLQMRRKRRAASQRYRNRHKRDESSYTENKPELMNYRADNDGEIDDEDDEMHDDGFDDQTSNFLSKRQADYDSDNYETSDEQESNDDYPIYMERNKRNALRMYDDENDAEESYDNFLFYPNRYSRMKRHNYENLAAIHGGGMMQHAAAMRERNMQPYEQNLRRKRLEKMNRMHEQQRGNTAELSESDIFGGFPQSYEGELSRFKRVKRSYNK